jgi:hypothetical protein
MSYPLNAFRNDGFGKKSALPGSAGSCILILDIAAWRTIHVIHLLISGVESGNPAKLSLPIKTVKTGADGKDERPITK